MTESEHIFGGQWTEDKLKRLEKYLKAYRVIFSRSRRARNLTTWYVDAFAGTGFRSEPRAQSPLRNLSLLEALGEPYAEIDVAPRKGSAQIALGLDSPFDHYLFVDSSRNHIRQLETMIEQRYGTLRNRCILRNEDANTALCDWCLTVDWNKNRAVVFLDPYGMQVEWKTVEALAATHGIDLWYLFPLAALARMMPKTGIISPSWKRRIDASIGTSEWADYFYPESMFESLIDGSRPRIRDASVERLWKFVNARLSTCFVAVAEGIVFRNSRESPMFLLCFAASNAAGAATAVKIAEDIMNPRTSGRSKTHAR